MDANIVTNLITVAINWLSQPETIAVLTGFAMTIPQYVQKWKDAKQKNVLEFIIMIAKEESPKLINTFMNNEQKKEKLFKVIYDKTPEKMRKYITQEQLEIAALGVYHAVVKPQIKPSDAPLQIEHSGDKINIDIPFVLDNPMEENK